MDDDIVSESNLQRQILYNTDEIGKAKVNIAAQKLKALNPHTKFITYNHKLREDNAHEIISKYDIVVDGCDNLPTRYIIDSNCKKLDKVYVYGSIAEFTGQISVFNYKGGISYNDLYPYSSEINNITQAKGVIGVLPGIIASLQANEVLKVICNYGEILSGKLLLFDSLKNHYIIVNI
jgi:adenylyltransferase/sulfurtransferase